MQHPLPKSHIHTNLISSRRSLRIAMVTEPYPPGLQGAASTVARIAEGLRLRDHTVQLVRPKHGPLDNPRRRAGLENVLTPAISFLPYRLLRVGLPSRQALAGLWTERRPDLVHIATEGPLGWSALQAALALKLPVCSDFRTDLHVQRRLLGAGWLQKPIMAYLRNFHNRCHCTMVSTEALRRQLSAEGFSPLSVVTRGVDTQRFSPRKRNPALRAQWGVGDTDVAALYVGGMAQGDDLELLLQAFQQLRCRQPAARLVVLGDDPAHKALRARCRQAIFGGHRTGDELAMWYASSDLLLLPGRTANCGDVVSEAMASGLATVAFNSADAGQQIAHQYNGLLASTDDVSTFFRLSADLAHDTEMRRRLGAQAREKAHQHGWEGIVLRIEDLYAATMATANATPRRRVWAQARMLGAQIDTVMEPSSNKVGTAPHKTVLITMLPDRA